MLRRGAKPSLKKVAQGLLSGGRYFFSGSAAVAAGPESADPRVRRGGRWWGEEHLLAGRAGEKRREEVIGGPGAAGSKGCPGTAREGVESMEKPMESGRGPPGVLLGAAGDSGGRS